MAKDRKNKKDQLYDLFQKIPDLENREQIFDLTCRISSTMESLSQKELKEISKHNEFFINVIWDVFHHDLFIESIESVLNLPHEVRREKLLDKKEIIQLFLRLSFFTVSALAPVFDKETIYFISKHFSTSVQEVSSEMENNGNLKEILYLLEDINFNSEYIYQKSTPINLDTDYLNMNQISARIFTGVLLLRNEHYYLLPKLFNDVTQGECHPNKLSKFVSYVKRKMGLYTHFSQLLKDRYFDSERRKKIKEFVNVLTDENVEDILLLTEEVMPLFAPEKIERSISNKINKSSYIKNKIQEKFENLDVFDSTADSSGRWSNKAFLNTVMFFSALESIKEAQDRSWKRKTFDYLLNRWIANVNEIVNYYNIEDAKTKVIYVEGISDKIILENAYEKLHPDHDEFIFYHAGGKKELFKKINASQINDFEQISFGIFDFDEAYNDFVGLRSDSKNINGFSNIKGKDSDCLYRVREGRNNKIFAMLLPVPQYRQDIASTELRNKSLLSIEMMFPNYILQKSNNLKEEKLPGASSTKVFGGDKIKFAKNTKNFSKADFKSFRPLFERLFELTEQI